MKRGVSPSLCQSRMGPSVGREENHLDSSVGFASKQPLQRLFGCFSSRFLIARPRLHRQLLQAAAELHGELVADAFTMLILVRRDQFVD